MRPVVAELRKRFDVAVSEAGHLDLHRRALIGVAAVAAESGHVGEVLDACERLVAGRPELELLSARRRLLGPEDD
ncbi:YlxP-like protein [Actinokineospora spheciospongiae]|uniref:YlxP-like protein n=1 Tax=Actinokineospora spheciospongiae TaxID=909613 RepID=W7J1L0_9PSEU|nr:YlxP-like protein [Actinokineospora spheciospongiae]